MSELGRRFVQERSMDIDWRELPFTVSALGLATIFLWGIAHFG